MGDSLPSCRMEARGNMDTKVTPVAIFTYNLNIYYIYNIQIFEWVGKGVKDRRKKRQKI
jgi:hypothetical protein